MSGLAVRFGSRNDSASCMSVLRRPDRVVVESRSEREGCYQRELVKCGKARCKRCKRKPTHGPYWYLYQWLPGKHGARGRLRSTYIGKEFERRIG
jgi:hypothetical protein